MTITTEVRINWPVPAVALLDHVTRVAGGDPTAVRRRSTATSVANELGQGLRTLADVWFSELPDNGDAPPAHVILTIDNPYGFKSPTGIEVQAREILPAVVEWLDAQGVPRDRWWWEDESRGTYHPGTCDVALLLSDEPRPMWLPDRDPADR